MVNDSPLKLSPSQMCRCGGDTTLSVGPLLWADPSRVRPTPSRWIWLVCREWWACVLNSKYSGTNPSIAATLGEQQFGHYIGVAFIEGLFCTQTVHLGPGCLAIYRMQFAQQSKVWVLGSTKVSHVGPSFAQQDKVWVLGSTKVSHVGPRYTFEVESSKSLKCKV